MTIKQSAERFAQFIVNHNYEPKEKDFYSNGYLYEDYRRYTEWVDRCGSKDEFIEDMNRQLDAIRRS